MKKIFACFCVLICLIMVSSALADAIPEIVLAKADSVFYVQTDTICSGTAFVISNNDGTTLLLTNNHVIEENPNEVSVYLSEEDTTHATVVVASEQYDLAVLKTNQPLSANPLEFETECVRGDAVYAIGFPAASDVLSSTSARISSEATLTDGVISKINKMRLVSYGPEVGIIQTTATVNPGNSGGPLLNNQGKVVGVNTYCVNVDVGQGVYGAVAADDVLTFLSANNINLQSGTTQNQKLIMDSDNIPVVPNWLIGIIILTVLFIVYILCAVLTGKSKRKARKNKQQGSITLEEYLQKAKGAVSYNDIAQCCL